MFDRLSIQFYGGSHEPKMGAIIQGLPKGSIFSYENIENILKRRGMNSEDSTSRNEDDKVVFISGVKEINNKFEIIGNEVEFYIENKNYKDEDYNNIISIPRPSHADYAAFKKHGEIPIGGGKYSGRMTALLCVIGSIALDVINIYGISISSKIKSLGNPKENDSYGGIITCNINGVKAGQLGDAIFDGLEGKIAYSIFGVPAVKGIEFGEGFALAQKNGSETNDEIEYDGKDIIIKTNHMGGIDGGISNGNPIEFNVAIKPVPSISKTQHSVDLKTNQNVEININGRHDKCIVYRALPCIESCAAIAILDEVLKCIN